jgi:tripartite-type tricarboxylate transporter receptor subunit TctC
MHRSSVRTWASRLVTTLLSLATTIVAAQPFPTKPIRLLVGAPAGGTTDTLARAVGQETAKLLGQSLVVENRPGAGGNIAAETVARASADGYTLLMSFTSHTINATLYPNLAFDPLADFTPITMIATVPSVLVGNPSLPAKDLKELLALLHAKPGKLNMAIGALGSSLHMASDLFKMKAGVDAVDVPYKGSAPAMADVIAGQAELMFVSVVVGAPQIKAGKLRAYGVTSLTRLAQLPDVPAIAEFVPDFESNAWFGVFGPARLPSDVTKKLNDAFVNALGAPELKQRLEAEGAAPVGNSPSAFAAFVKEDVKRWAPVVKASGAKPE